MRIARNTGETQTRQGVYLNEIIYELYIMKWVSENVIGAFALAD